MYHYTIKTFMLSEKPLISLTDILKLSTDIFQYAAKGRRMRKAHPCKNDNPWTVPIS